MGQFDRTLKQMVWERDGGHCVRCGVAVWQGDIHHRHARGMGGRDSHEEWINHHSNLLLLCRGCHDWIEEHREVAAEYGWLVPAGLVPEDVPVRYWDHIIYRLHGDFFLTPVGVWAGADVRS